MMDRTVYSAIAAALLASTSAQAVSLNARGVGQVLLYPYYTVNKGQDTLISIVNTSAMGKVFEIDSIVSAALTASMPRA